MYMYICIHIFINECNVYVCVHTNTLDREKDRKARSTSLRCWASAAASADICIREQVKKCTKKILEKTCF